LIHKISKKREKRVFQREQDSSDWFVKERKRERGMLPQILGWEGIMKAEKGNILQYKGVSKVADGLRGMAACITKGPCQ